MKLNSNNSILEDEIEKKSIEKTKKKPKSTQTNLLISDPGHEIEITLQLANKKIIRPIYNRSNVKG